MSNIEQSSNSKKYVTSSNDSMKKKVLAQTNTSQSMNTDSYEYYNQKITTKKYITETSYSNLNQNSNSINSNFNIIPKKRVLSGRNQQLQSKIKTPELKCTCKKTNEKIKNGNFQCTCKRSFKNEEKVNSTKFKKKIFEEEKSENKSGQGNYGFQTNQQKTISSISSISSKNNLNQKSQTYQVGGSHNRNKNTNTSQYLQNKIITYVSPNNQNLQLSENYSSIETRKSIGKKTEFNQDNTVNNYSYFDSNQNNIDKISQTYNHSNNSNINTHTVNRKINTNLNINRSYSYDNRLKINNSVDDWRRKCVGQNNESLIIKGAEKPELTAQCVQDMQVIQDPKPVQILLPMAPNEIDYTLGLEIYGRDKLSEEEEIARRLKSICPENIDSLNISKAYSTISPQFENLNIENYNIFCEKKIRPQPEYSSQNNFEIINRKNKERKALSVEHSSDFRINNSRSKKAFKREEPLVIENEEMKIYTIRNFNKVNQKEVTTKMNVQGINKLDWNEANEAIKTTKMNIEPAYEKKDFEGDENESKYRYKGEKSEEDENEKESESESVKKNEIKDESENREEIEIKKESENDIDNEESKEINYDNKDNNLDKKSENEEDNDKDLDNEEDNDKDLDNEKESDKDLDNEKESDKDLDNEEEKDKDEENEKEEVEDNEKDEVEESEKDKDEDKEKDSDKDDNNDIENDIENEIENENDIESDNENDIDNDIDNQNLEEENFALNIFDSGRKFRGPLNVQKKGTYNYQGKKINIFDKFKKNVSKESNEMMEYPAEFPKVDWNQNTIPMSGRPFSIDKKPVPTLSTSNVEKIALKGSYKTKDWNKSINERKVININMTMKKSKKQNLSKHRVPPVILKGREKDWNKVNQRENDSKLSIGKSIKTSNFVLSKENELLIENDNEEILINDDYNIVEENYTRPIRANIRKVQDYIEEESGSSEYDILKNIHKHEEQYIQYRELISESMKINGQKVIINDISGKYPRRVETFHGMDENEEKGKNDYNKNQNQKNKNKSHSDQEQQEEGEEGGPEGEEGDQEGEGDQEEEGEEAEGDPDGEEGEGSPDAEGEEEINQKAQQNQQNGYYNEEGLGNSQQRKRTYEPERNNNQGGDNEEERQNKNNLSQNMEENEENYDKDIEQSSGKKFNQENYQEPEDENEPEYIHNQEAEQESGELPEDEDHDPNKMSQQQFEYQNHSQIQKEQEDQEEDDQQEQEHENENEEKQIQFKNQEQYYYQKNIQGQELEGEQQHINLYYNDNRNQKLSPNIKQPSPRSQGSRGSKNLNQENINGKQIINQQNQEEEHLKYIYKDASQNQNEEAPKIFIKEITYTKNEESPEENKIRLRYITLNRIEGQEEGQNQNINENKELNIIEQNKIINKEEVKKVGRDIQENDESEKQIEINGNGEENNEENQVNQEREYVEGQHNIQENQEQSKSKENIEIQVNEQDQLQDYEPENENNQEYEEGLEEEHEQEQNQELQQIKENEQNHDLEQEHEQENEYENEYDNEQENEYENEQENEYEDEHENEQEIDNAQVEEGINQQNMNIQVSERKGINNEEENQNQEEKQLPKVTSTEEITGQNINIETMDQGYLMIQNESQNQNINISQNQGNQIQNIGLINTKGSNQINKSQSSPKSPNNEIQIKAHIIETNAESGIRQSPQSYSKTQQIKQSSQSQIQNQQITQSSKGQTQIKTFQEEQGGKYPSLIQGFSKHLMTTPSDNYNNFATNKLNIIPLSSNQNERNKEKINKTSQVILKNEQQIIQNQNMMDNARLGGSVESNGSIKYSHNMQSLNPILYSFADKTGSSVVQKMDSSENKNILNINENVGQKATINNSDFLISSLSGLQKPIGMRQGQRLRAFGDNDRTGNENIDDRMGSYGHINSGSNRGLNNQYLFNNLRIKRDYNNNNLSGSNRFTADFDRQRELNQFGQFGTNIRSDNYYYGSTFNQLNSSNFSKREPIDGNTSKKKLDFNRLAIEPRDSRRKY